MQDQEFPQDSTNYTFREIDSSFLDSLINSGEYDYVNQKVNGKGLWESIRDFIFGWLREQGVFLGDWVENLLIIICLIALVLGTLYFFSTYRSKNRSRLKGHLSPNLHEKEEEWNEEYVTQNLQRSKEDQDWRAAVRWCYHLGLILLNEKEIIQRSEFKTAYDYQNEVSNPKIKAHFIQLKNLHERAWYDEVDIQKEELRKSEESIRGIKQTLNETD